MGQPVIAKHWNVCNRDIGARSGSGRFTPVRQIGKPKLIKRAESDPPVWAEGGEIWMTLTGDYCVTGDTYCTP